MAQGMTLHIKGQIRARQKAFSEGDTERYQQLKDKVGNLIKNAKRRFYETKASELRVSSPHKWLKSIYALCGAEKQRTTLIAPTPDDLRRGRRQAVTSCYKLLQHPGKTESLQLCWLQN